MQPWPADSPSALYAELSREFFAAEPVCGLAEADVAVIGGGIGGLSAALHLRQAGVSTVLLEARTVGAGASGRNNGQVIPTLTRHDPKAILAVMGPERGELFLRMLQASADLLFDTASRYAIDCDVRRTGWIQPAHSPGRARLAAARARQWQERGAPAEALDAATLADHLGSDVYYGGWRHGGAGHINPLAFTRGLARAVVQEGGQIHENSPVLSMQREADGWHLRTPAGEVRCRRVVLVTAAYTAGLWPGLARTIVPVTSYQLASAPLPPGIAARILPCDEAASDTRNDLRYFRKDRDGRLITGGALAVQAAVRPRLETLVKRKLAETFAFLGEPTLPFFWGGRIAMTTNRLPRLHRTQDGLISWIGCNGRGLALSMAMGGVMRDAVLGLPDDQLPLAPTAFVPIPLHPIVRRVARLALIPYRRKDAREVG
jgi:glycine/D-amino acid oxidase-like deaminating enzyme